MKNRLHMIFVAALGLTSIAAASCDGGGGGSSSSQSHEPPASSGGLVELKDKTIDKDLFDNPSLDDRPMVMAHNSSEGQVDDIYQRGYGGLVTNVSWNSKYLNDESDFERLDGVISHAIDDYGMHVWLYDEYGYPSGTAHGQTLDGHPEYEALGLVVQYAAIASGEAGTINLLHGHTAIVKAFVFDGESEDTMNLSTAVDVSSNIADDKTSVTYQNGSGSSKVLVAYMSKPWYENTHSMENWYAQQRYINMLEKGGPERFIDLTYKKYQEHFGDRFGKGVNAFFTDEPALQGNYFTISSRDREVIDEPDPDVPIVPCLNYADTLFDQFKEAYGYDLEPYLGYLYKDDGSQKAKQVRIDFYWLTSELMRQNYLKAISDYCDSVGIKSSGHLLLEECLYQNPWFEGDMIQLIGQMGIPGSDMLYSTPTGCKDFASIVSKMTESAASFEGKTETFAEISGAFDNTVGDMYHQLNAVGVQVLNGINNFASYYYQGGDHTKEEDKIFSTAIGRMRYLTTGSQHRARVALYYPYEGASAETLPSENMNDPTDSARSISNSFMDMCRELTSKQVDYTIVDSVNLAKCTVADGYITAPSGEAFEAVVVPSTTAIRSEAINKLAEISAGGIEIVLANVATSVVCETAGSDAASKWGDIYKKAHKERSTVGVAKYLRSNGFATMTLSDDRAADIYMSTRESKNYWLYTVCNAYDEDKALTFALSNVSPSSIQVYNPVEGTIEDIADVTVENGEAKFAYIVPANRTVFFVVNK